MTWTLTMIVAIACYVFGAALFASGYALDESRRGLAGAALLLIAPFLFYAAGAL